MSAWKHLRAVLIGPVVVTIAVPLLIAVTIGAATITLSQPLSWILIGLGVLVALAGLAMLAWTIGLFGRFGGGTLSPFDPTDALVVRGPYRHVRNPMFSGVLAILLGEALALRSPTMLCWLLVFFGFLSVIVPMREEPQLAYRFGAEYERYRANVPRWLPRTTPWSPPTGGPG